jgi:hypothetical protein
MKLHVLIRLSLACLLGLLIHIPVASAQAFNFSSLSNARLVELSQQVTREIVARGINKTARLPQGIYVAGKDIPAGRYVYTCMATGDDWGNLFIYSSTDKSETLLHEVVSAPERGQKPQTLFFTLSDGNQLESSVPFAITITQGVVFN